MIAWRIYYADGSTFSNAEGAPAEAPGLGVAIIVQLDEDVGRHLLCGWDWYHWHADHGQWWGSDLFGLQDQLTSDRVDVVRAVKAGRSMHTPEYRAIYARAVRDPDFPDKSGRLPSERVL